MMIFSADTHPKALVQNKGEPFTFTCGMCGATEEGVRVRTGGSREDWAVLPDDWAEIEDRRKDVKKPFVVCCQGAECRHEASSRSG